MDNDSIIHFEEGIIGVPRARRFVLLEQPGSSVRVLRCLDIEGLNLPVVDPRLADPGYEPRLGPRVTDALELCEGDTALLLAVTSLEQSGATANLKAPVVVNVRHRQAAQIILDNPAYSLRTPVKVEETVSTR